MPSKTLVTYVSRNGSTADIATEIGAILRQHGHAIDVVPMPDVTDLSPYGAVVMGCPIFGGQWMPEARQFVKTHQATLPQHPVAAFVVCMLPAMQDKYPTYNQLIATYFDPIRAVTTPVDTTAFAGVFYVTKIKSVLDRFAMFMSNLLSRWPQGDHRDWDAIRAWANSLPAKL